MCVSEREKKKLRGQGSGENNHITAAQGRWAGRGQGSHQQAQTTAQTPQASESRTTLQSKTPKKEGKEILGEREESVEDSRVLPHLTPPILSSQQENATVKHGGSDCGLVEAVSVSGRGDALISPVRVKDTGACKADPGFVLHCLCCQSDCYNLD